jgi:hypothetical protein
MTLDAAIEKLSNERDQRIIRQIAKPTASAALSQAGGEQNEY